MELELTECVIVTSINAGAIATIAVVHQNETYRSAKKGCNSLRAFLNAVAMIRKSSGLKFQIPLVTDFHVISETDGLNLAIIFGKNGGYPHAKHKDPLFACILAAIIAINSSMAINADQ